MYLPIEKTTSILSLNVITCVRVYVCVLALLDRILIEILYRIALSISHYCHRLDDERIINVTGETLSSNLIRWYWRLLKMRRMSIVLSGEHRNVSITRDSFYRGWCALRDIEALTLQIEAVRYKRSAERCRISAYPHLCHSTWQAYRG